LTVTGPPAAICRWNTRTTDLAESNTLPKRTRYPYDRCRHSRR
jgi:hypothetical protein